VEFFVAIGHTGGAPDGLVFFLDPQLSCGVIIVLLMHAENQNAYPSQPPDLETTDKMFLQCLLRLRTKKRQDQFHYCLLWALSMVRCPIEIKHY
jgi:hypothetical protein